MSRFLFVVPPLAGHVNPTIAVGRALQEAGHEVAWVGSESQVRRLIPADLRLIPIDETEIAQVSEKWAIKAQTVFGLESFKFFFEEFLIPLGRFMVPSVQAAVDAYKPDLLICDQQALAGFIVARKNQIPWVTLATTSAAVFNPLEQFPKVREWMTEKFGELQDGYGLDRIERPDISPQLAIIFSARVLLGQNLEFPPHYRFVGPSIRTESNHADFPWDYLSPVRRRVYLSLGTLNAERSVRFYEKVKLAFAGKDLQLILSAPPEMVGEVPDNFIVRKHVPQLELLKKVDAVIFHGGHNTFCESLFNGLPLVVVPIKDDQPVIAEQVVRTGVGLRLHFDRVKSDALFEATRRILDEPEFRAAARRIQAALKVCGGAREAAHLLIETNSTKG